MQQQKLLVKSYLEARHGAQGREWLLYSVIIVGAPDSLEQFGLAPDLRSISYEWRISVNADAGATACN